LTSLIRLFQRNWQYNTICHEWRHCHCVSHQTSKCEKPRSLWLQSFR